jgi:predicted HicB family RNase H-like nuclease
MLNILSCKGYTARVEFDARDDIFVGRVLGVRDIISFHAETVGDLRRQFERAIDDYLSDCEVQGVSPEKPASGRLMLRAPPEVHAGCLRRAIRRRESESVGQQDTGIRRAASITKGRFPNPLL